MMNAKSAPPSDAVLPHNSPPVRLNAAPEAARFAALNGGGSRRLDKRITIDIHASADLRAVPFNRSACQIDLVAAAVNIGKNSAAIFIRLASGNGSVIHLNDRVAAEIYASAVLSRAIQNPAAIHLKFGAGQFDSAAISARPGILYDRPVSQRQRNTPVAVNNDQWIAPLKLAAVDRDMLKCRRIDELYARI